MRVKKNIKFFFGCALFGGGKKIQTNEPKKKSALTNFDHKKILL